MERKQLKNFDEWKESNSKTFMNEKKATQKL